MTDIECVMNALKSEFEITIGSAKVFVGIEIERNRKDKIIFLHQESYANKITQAHKKKKLSVLGWKLYFSFVFFPAESDVKSRGLTAYIEHNLKKLSKNHVSVEKLEKKKKTLFPSHQKHFLFMYFGLLNRNLLWKKRFNRLISEITSKNYSVNLHKN